VSALIRAENLAKRYPSGAGELTVFSGLDFEIRGGESVAFVGASGAGKSTLLHLIGALDDPSEGEVYYQGAPLTQRSEAELARYRNESVGYVWQSYHLLPEFTALENAAMPLLIAGEERGRANQQALAWLERFGLSDRASHQAGELSGGEQQRVAIARALVRGPRLVLADEPTGNLDAATGESIIGRLLALPAEQNLAVVMATHNLGFARRCNRVLRIAQGRLETEAPSAAMV